MSLRLLAAIAALGAISFCAVASAQTSGLLPVIGVENEYADVLTQIGGEYVKVEAILSDPNTDPHTFEASPRLAREIAGAQLVVENGVGYDAWADKLMAASSRPHRKLINVQKLLGLPDDTSNPHLWYDPKTMPAVAKAAADALAALKPAQAAYFHANAESFIASLKPWNDAIAAFRTKYADTPVATTEPVSDYLLTAMGARLMTPPTLEKAIMDGNDPAPQDLTIQNDLFTGHKVKLFAYNQQVVSATTKSLLELSRKEGIPVVGVYETMPTPGYHYQSWMLAEVQALEKAVGEKQSTESLQK